MRESNGNQMRRQQYKEIEMVPYAVRQVKTKEEADLVLTKRKDMCDFVALGFYCLRLSAQGIKKSEIKVFYSSKFFKGDSGFSVSYGKGQTENRRNALTEGLCTDITPVMFYINNEENKQIVRVLAMLMCIEITSRVDNLCSVEHGRVQGISAMECIETFKMDSMKAQRRAYEISVTNLDRRCW